MNLVVIAHNIRSAHNVGSIFRTCEGFGADTLYLTGYTPYPKAPGDQRLPHLIERLEKKINKTAIGAEKLVPFEHEPDVISLLTELKQSGYRIVGLEQADNAVAMNDFTPPKTCALLLGEEVQGIPEEAQKLCDHFVEIPMCGQKQSFNVAVAAGIAMYGLTNTKT